MTSFTGYWLTGGRPHCLARRLSSSFSPLAGRAVSRALDPLTVPTTDGALTGLANCDGQDVPLGPCHRFGPDVELHRFHAEPIGAAKTAASSPFVVLSTANGPCRTRTSLTLAESADAAGQPTAGVIERRDRLGRLIHEYHRAGA